MTATDKRLLEMVGLPRPQAWGGRYFLDNQPGGRNPQQSVLVYSNQYTEPRFFWLQVRFAIDQGLLNSGQPGQPALPWSETMVNAGSAIGEITFKVTRSVSGQGGNLEDTYVVSGAPTEAGQTSWFPVMVLPGCQLVINGTNTGDFALWVDVAIVPLQTLTQEQLMALRWSTASGGAQGINARPNVFGFGDVPGTIANGPKRTAASAAPVLLLPADSTRRQFWITNEGDQRLALRFSNHDPDVSAGNESWDVILAPKGGAGGLPASYQSPVDAYWGEVRGVWEGVTPGGFAMADAAIYFLQPNDEAL